MPSGITPTLMTGAAIYAGDVLERILGTQANKMLPDGGFKRFWATWGTGIVGLFLPTLLTRLGLSSATARTIGASMISRNFRFGPIGSGVSGWLSNSGLGDFMTVDGIGEPLELSDDYGLLEYDAEPDESGAIGGLGDYVTTESF